MAIRIREIVGNSFADVKTDVEFILSQDTAVSDSKVDFEKEGTNIKAYVYQVFAALTQTDAAPGLNDGTFAGTYTGSEDVLIEVEIDASVPTPDTFKWSKDGVEQATGVNCAASVALVDGITIAFGANDGHTIGDTWTLWAMIS